VAIPTPSFNYDAEISRTDRLNLFIPELSFWLLAARSQKPKLSREFPAFRIEEGKH
jgi:hypothetical protein